jgi:hypothetical protein
MRFDSMNRLLRRATLALGAVLAAGLLAACGGEGAGAGGSAAGAAGSTATDILVFSDKATLPATDGSTTATITAQVKDATNNVVRNQRVTFSTTDSGVALSPVGTSSVTDSAGRIQVRLDLGASAAARSRRAVVVNATSGAAGGTTTIQVVGTTLTVTGSTTLTVGTAANFTVTATDATSKPVAGLPITVTFSGGTPASTTVTSGANGQAAVTLTGTTPGEAVIRASATGVDPQPLTVNVVGSDSPFRVIAPSEAEVGTAQAVTVQYRQNGNPVPGQAIVVSTSRGTIDGQPSVTRTTNAQGEIVLTASSASAGQAEITATLAGGVAGSVSSRIAFVSRTPAKISLSPDPSSIAANAPGSTSSSSRLVATVRDAADNPVKDALVTFSATDPSNGSISPGSARSDASGQAVASFIAGPTSSSDVRVTASVFNSAGTLVAQDTKTLTVSAVALFVELGTGNTIEAVDNTTYSMPWSAIVTDANRNPISGLPVSVSLVAVNYFKGIWVYGGSAWVPRSFNNTTQPPLTCASEDTNANNLRDPGEDVNGNNLLEPGSPASVRVTSADAKTGADGRATLSVIYPKSFGEWVEVTMRVTIGTPGTESAINRTFVLPVLAADVTSQTTAPPNVGRRTPTTVTPAGALVGPYGYVQDCTNPN